jgi:hypothetical protein
MPKQIKADLEQVVEGVVLEVLPTFKFNSRLSNNTDDADYIRRKLRTALEQFVVEEKDEQTEVISEIERRQRLIISEPNGVVRETMISMLLVDLPTPTKGGSNG